ncbi:winged helix-turn-helix transcriptional regulator [Chitinophaga sp. Hz27]|uniref:winged helix-turn-helix transcriptional regulator n=1 Tax=Chitinophaga sp. Hz27 TaxID=3347169 RepID=UPI0035DCD54D
MRKLQSTNTSNLQQLVTLCPISYTLIVMGGRWKALIIDRLTKQPMRYSELKKSIPFVAEKALTLQLKELEQDGLIQKIILQEKPPRNIEYHLTDKGKSLHPVLTALYEWGKENNQPIFMEMPAIAL